MLNDAFGSAHDRALNCRTHLLVFAGEAREKGAELRRHPRGGASMSFVPRFRGRAECLSLRLIKSPKSNLRISSLGGADSGGDPECGLPHGHADSGPRDPAVARGPRCARPGADRHRKDGGVRLADAGADRRGAEGAAGSRSDADPRAGDPGCRCLQALWRRFARSAGRDDLRRPGLPDPVPATRSRRSRRRGHAGPGHGPHEPRLAQARRAARAGAGRSRRNAADGLCGGRGLGAHPGARPSGRSRSSRPPFPNRSGESPSGTCGTPPRSRSSREPPPPIRCGSDSWL